MSDGEPRVPLVGDDEAAAVAAAVFAKADATAGQVPNLYRTLAHAPELLEAWIALAWPLRHDATSARSVRELVIMRTAQLTGADYEWRQHWRMAIEAGVSQDQLLALHDWPASELFDADERAALAMADDLTVSADIAEQTWAGLCGRFNERERIELVLTAAFYACVSRVLNGLAVPLEDSAAGIPPLDEVMGPA